MILPKVIIAVSLGAVLASELKVKERKGYHASAYGSNGSADEFEMIDGPRSEEEPIAAPPIAAHAVIRADLNPPPANEVCSESDSEDGDVEVDTDADNLLLPPPSTSLAEPEEHEGNNAEVTNDLANVQVAHSGPITVDGKTFTVDELCRALATIDLKPTGLTESYSFRIERLKIAELVSKMFDLLDFENFDDFLAKCAANMPLSARLWVLTVLNKHFEAADCNEATRKLGKFLEVFGNYPVSEIHYNAYLKLLKAELKEFTLSVQKFANWEISEISRLVAQVQIARASKVNGLLASGKFNEALALLSEAPLVRLDSDFVTVLALITTFSSARFEFVKDLLRVGVLDANLKTPKKKEHVLFSLASCDKNCNDIVKAFLMHPECEKKPLNKKDHSLRHVASKNHHLDKPIRKILSSLVKCEEKELLSSIDLNF